MSCRLTIDEEGAGGTGELKKVGVVKRFAGGVWDGLGLDCKRTA